MTHLTGGNQRVPVKVWDGDGAVPFEEEALNQVRRVAQMPFVFHHVALMPDGHSGTGATVGSVIATKGAVIPAAVGVDIGCGMMAQRLNMTADQLGDLYALRLKIEAAVPHGRTDNGGPNDRGAWGQLPETHSPRYVELVKGLQPIMAKYPDLVKRVGTVGNQLGTLGTGNHFIEVCTDEEGKVWVLLHSGSRGIGNRIGSFFISKAKEQAARHFYEQYLPEKDLAYLPEGTPVFDDYIEAVTWAQEYALTNRWFMMGQTLVAMGVPPLDGLSINCHHNYIAREHHFGKDVIVTRKGAVRARVGDLGIIPGSMGARSFIVEGRGSEDSFQSCSHGAGRVMSRTDAKRKFTEADLAAQTEGVECRKDKDVIDEAPKAYKDIDAVMAAQADLVSIKHTLKQVICVKG